MNQNGNKIKLYERVARLEECYNSLQNSLDEIKNNHLAHLNARLDTIEKSLNQLSVDYKITVARWAGGASVVLVLINIALHFIK